MITAKEANAMTIQKGYLSWRKVCREIKKEIKRHNFKHNFWRRELSPETRGRLIKLGYEIKDPENSSESFVYVKW